MSLISAGVVALLSCISLWLAYRLYTLQARNSERIAVDQNLYINLSDVRGALDEHFLVTFADTAGKITFANDRFCTTSQYALEELIGQDHRIVNSGYHPQTFFRALHQTISHGEVWKGEICNRSRDGSVFWVFTTIAPLLDSEGKPYQYIAIRTDITEQKRIEAQLGSSRRLLEQAMNATDLVAWQFNPNTGIFTWNDHFYALLGTTAEAEGGYEMPAATYLERFCHPDDRQRVQDEISRAISTPPQDDFYTIEYCIVRLDTGKKRDVLVRYNGVYNAAGELINLVGALQDITQRQQVQRELESARQAAEVANRAKTAFLTNMSHEIRTPLNAISGFIELMGHNPSPEDQARMLQSTRESISALTGIIDDVLDLSKIEAGKFRIRPETISLRSTVESAVAMFHGSAFSKGLYLRQQYDERIPTAVLSDPLRLKQILFNLIGNAIKFTSTGGVKVGTHWESEAQGKVRVRIEIEDTGIGVSEQDQARLFQPFSQASHELGGTGLGLVISRRLAEMLGGSLTLRSRAGNGTIMTLSLHLKVEAQSLLPATSPAPKALENAQAALPRKTSNTRLLVVDDNEFNLAVLTRQLAMLGFEADVSHDGREALEKIQQTNYGLIISDCHMPTMDGFELTRNIRQLENAAPLGHKTVVIAYTADAMSESREMCLEAGMNDVLIKPVSLKDLDGKLQHWLGEATGPSELPGG